MTANSKLVVLAAALGFIPTYLYWLLVVQPPAKKKKMLQVALSCEFLMRCPILT